MAGSTSDLCLKCGQPMRLALPPGGDGPRSMRCIDCEDPDPLTRPDLAKLVDTLKFTPRRATDA
jgi:hypothetical protein